MIRCRHDMRYNRVNLMALKGKINKKFKWSKKNYK